MYFIQPKDNNDYCYFIEELYDSFEEAKEAYNKLDNKENYLILKWNL